MAFNRTGRSLTMLELDGVTRLYGSHQGARNVSFEAATGSRTVIVGPSGSGKTTLLRLIAGFEEPDAGTIRLGGTLLAGPGHLTPPHRRDIAYVPQEGALFPHLSVAGNIGFALPRRAPDRNQTIDRLLDRVGLPQAMRDRRPHELSGGQQQRVALARALAQNPRLMLLDEPFSALDAGLREAMRTMVGNVLAQSGVTSVLVTHDQTEALAFADHLVVMRDGEVADAGPPQRLYAQPRDIETARFLGEAILLPATIDNGVAKTPLGPLPVSSASNGPATVLLRPEQIVLEREAKATLPQLQVRQRTFGGPTWRLEVEAVSTSLPPFFVLSAEGFDTGTIVPFSIRGTAHVLPPDRTSGHP
jgi:iron(III) transport system ATP-binding protein